MKQAKPTLERIGMILSAVAALVWLPQAWIIATVLGGLLVDPAQVAILSAVVAFVLLAVLRALLDAIANDRLSRAADQQINDIRRQIVSREAACTGPAITGGPGAIAALAADKAEALRPFLLRYKPARLRTMVIPPVILIIAFWHSWAVAVVLLVAGPLVPVFMALVGWAAKSASEKQLAEIGGMSDLLVDRLAALPDLRLFGAGAAVVDSFALAAERLRERTMAVLRIAFLSSTILELFAALGVAMVAVWVGFALLGAITWGGSVTPTTGIFLLLLAPEYFQPLRDLAAAWHDRAAASAVLDEWTAYHDETRPKRMGHGADPVPVGAIDLRAEGLIVRGIAYPPFDLAPGQSLAITGPSGSGKTTLLRCLAGLERPEAGTVWLGKVPLDDATVTAWQRGIGWMPQSPHFMGQSLRHNIGFGEPLNANVLSAAQVAEVIAALPKGDATILGERGGGLSGGEARRITLARALNGGPAIVLADEPTADLDAETAQLIADALVGYAQNGGTLIVSTHDLGLAARLDRTITLGGKV